jgi:hypothetical protein
VHSRKIYVSIEFIFEIDLEIIDIKAQEYESIVSPETKANLGANK